jgi:indolepyruvate ferredoxin oxidoreductase beta subunit
MNTSLNMLFVGVGGQGVLTASDIAAQVGLASGFDAKKSEIHGFAQRGGIVESHVRWARRVGSPTCEKGTVDILIAFEFLESLRWIHWLVPEGIVITNLYKIPPMSVSAGKSTYPDQESILEELGKHASKVIAIDALSLAQEAGNPRTMNVVLLATLAETLEHDPSMWKKAILDRIPAKYSEVNRKAFHLGQQAAKASTPPTDI